MRSRPAKLAAVAILIALSGAALAEDGSFGLEAPLPVMRAERPGSGLLDQGPVSSGGSSALYREPPSLSTRYTLNGHTVLPYVGVGYGAGEPIDANRTMMRDNAGHSSMQEDRILRDLVGKSVLPNEFQLGVRIPF
jgi:hypothetical protein